VAMTLYMNEMIKVYFEFNVESDGDVTTCNNEWSRPSEMT
jgi:hypothetical protein